MKERAKLDLFPHTDTLVVANPSSQRTCYPYFQGISGQYSGSILEIQPSGLSLCRAVQLGNIGKQMRLKTPKRGFRKASWKMPGSD